MVKLSQSNDLNRRRGSSALLAIGLAASLAALGCTTNMNPGSGAPARITPDIRTTPTGGEPIGTENAPPIPPPMTSSYTRQEVVPKVTAVPRSLHHTPDEAAAIMAGSAPLRGRYLGPVNPGPAQRVYVAGTATTVAQYRLPYSVPEQTINSSIHSSPTEAVNSGAGVTESPSAAVIGAISGTPTTTAAATLPATPAVTTLTPTPTASISGNATVTAASVGAATTTTAATTASTSSTTTNATTPTVTAVSGSTNLSASSPVRIVRSSSGTTVTNTGTSARQ